MVFEKEDKRFSQENTYFSDNDPTDSQIVFAWLTVNGGFLPLKPWNESGEEKSPLLFISILSLKNNYLKSHSTTHNLYLSFTFREIYDMPKAPLEMLS